MASCTHFPVLIHCTEDGDASDDEDDLEVGGITQDYKCPLTLIPFVNPLTSSAILLVSLLMCADINGQDCVPTFIFW